MKLDESNVFHNKVALFDLIPIKQRDFASAEATRAFRSPWTFGCECLDRAIKPMKWAVALDLRMRKLGQGYKTHEVGGYPAPEVQQLIKNSTFPFPCRARPAAV